MIKVTFAPIKEVVVHEYIMVDMEDLLRERITPAGTMPLYWCNGVLFSFSSMPWTKDIVRDYLDGKIHWAEVHFTKMEKYRPVMDLNDKNYNAELKIRVIDTSKSALHQDFTKWLKKTG
jgi:hypothetical protein